MNDLKYKVSHIVKNQNRSNDMRGSILSIVDHNINNVSIITCNKGSIRSNHYHKKDYHFMYVLYGEINYFFKKIDDQKVFFLKVKNNQTIFTPKLEIHVTHFPVDTKLIVSSGFPRDQKTYEEDTVRVNFIDEKNIKSYLSKYDN